MAKPNQSLSPGEDRRDDVLRATCTVIARDGLDRASMRAIAHELGCTTGVLTHYFRDKNALLTFVFEAIVARLDLDSADPRDPRVELGDVAGLLQDYLPGTNEGQKWWKVWLSFTVAALSSRTEAERHQQLYARLRAMWADLFAALQERGQIDPSLDPAVEADCIVCLADGVGVQALISPDTMGAARQAAVIQAYVSKLAPAVTA